MKNVPIIYLPLIFICLISCENSIHKKRGKVISSTWGNRLEEGYLVNDSIRQGCWTYSDIENNRIDSVLVYEKGILVKVYRYFDGVAFSTSLLDSADQRLLINAKYYRQALKLYDRESDIEVGKFIFRKNCFGCHSYPTATEFRAEYKTALPFLSDSKHYRKDTLITFNEKEYADNHFIKRFLTENEKNSLKKFIGSDEYVRSWIN
jgi:hypothetical protein